MGIESVHSHQPPLLEIDLKKIGITVYPKSFQYYPPRYTDIDLDKTEFLVDKDRLHSAVECVSDIISFVNGYPLGDGWGNKHAERRKWEAKAVQQYGPWIQELFDRRNQFGLNSLAATQFRILSLSRILRHSESLESAASVNSLAQQFLSLLQGKPTGVPYHLLESVQTKLKIVHECEQIALETVEMFLYPKWRNNSNL